MKRIILAAFVCAALGTNISVSQAADAAKEAAPATPAPAAAEPVPAGSYTIDKSHTSIIFRVDHLGFSYFTGRFTRYDAKLEGDPRNPPAARLSVTIDPASIECDNPPAGFIAALRGAQWLDAAKYPKMTYQSKSIEMTGATTARVTGDFTMHGVTKPVTLDVAFNGGYAGHPMDPNARIGFSARGFLNRSDFGISYGIPPAGSAMGVSDRVEILIETEFSGPATKAAAK